MTAKVGAPHGNRNAVKHGMYSRSFTDAEKKEAAFLVEGELQPEINLFRVLIARTAAMLKVEEGEPLPSFQENVTALFVISMAIARLGSLIRTTENLSASDDHEPFGFFGKMGFSEEKTRVEIDRRNEKVRGGQAGNINALKHGYYASVFNPEELRRLEKVEKSEVNEEIALLRSLIKRTVVSMFAEPVTRQDYLRGIRVLTFAASCVEKLQRTSSLLFGGSEAWDMFMQAVREANLSQGVVR